MALKPLAWIWICSRQIVSCSRKTGRARGLGSTCIIGAIIVPKLRNANHREEFESERALERDGPYCAVPCYHVLFALQPLVAGLWKVQKQKAGDKNALDAQGTGESFTFAHSKSPPRERTAGASRPSSLYVGRTSQH
ncbi:hypothetical protein QYF36_018049 [Acer negundo]|nr:hypothetical protein QYF36_018049 [Acer negundo]